MGKVVVNVPEGYEVKVVKSKEKKKLIIKTYQDLIDNNIKINGYYINELSEILHDMDLSKDDNYFKRNIAASEKVAKSMLAMAMISQLMPYHGGEVTDEDWKDTRITKWAIGRNCDKITLIPTIDISYFLSFYTLEQCRDFLEYNERLIKDYLMID